MDSKDFQLLVALHENARQSYQSLGRRVSLSAPAVRERLKSLQSRGILQGYGLAIDPSVFDRDELIVLFRGEWKRQDVVKALAIRDVAWVAWKLDGGLTVGLWPRDPTQAVGDLSTALGARPYGQTSTERRSHQPLSLIDWEIIHPLIDEPTMSLRKLTESTGLSLKTVRKHVRLLFQTGALSVMPRQGAVAGPGELVYHIQVAGRAAMGEIRMLLGDAVVLHQTQQPPMKYVLCRGNDLSDVTAKTHALGQLPGVESVVITLNRELLFATNFAHSLVNERIQRWERSQKL